LAPAALLALAVCVVTFPATGGPAYEGWLPVVAIGSALLVLGLQPASPLRQVLSTRPLVWLGGISYGVYLYHWPVFVIADENRTGLDGWQLVVLEIGITLVLAQVSYALLEQPIRSLRRAPRRPTLIAGATATAAVAALAIVAVPGALGEYWQTDNATVQAAAIDVDDEALEPLQIESDPSTTVVTTTVPVTDPTTASPTAAPATTTSTTSAPPTTTTSTEAPLPALSRPVRIIVAGDSTAGATAAGLLTWAAEKPELAQVEVVGAPGCGFLRGGERRENGFRPPPDACASWLGDELPTRVAATQPDVVMLMVTTWDVVDHRWDDGRELTPLDPEFQQRLGDDYGAVTVELLELGAGSIAWVAPPVPNVWWGGEGTGQQDPARHAVVRDVIERLAASNPADVGVVDLAGWLDEAGLTDDHDVRPDGVHFDPEAALSVAEQFLGERLVRIALA
jgi:hypothetical protein